MAEMVEMGGEGVRVGMEGPRENHGRKETEIAVSAPLAQRAPANPAAYMHICIYGGADLARHDKMRALASSRPLLAIDDHYRC